MAGSSPIRRRTYRRRSLGRKWCAHLSRCQRAVETISRPGSGHSLGLRARPQTRLGMVQLASQRPRGSKAESRTLCPCRTGKTNPIVHFDHAKCRRTPRIGRQPKRAEAARKYLGCAMSRVRPRVGRFANFISRNSATVRLWRIASPRRSLVRRAAAQRHLEGCRSRRPIFGPLPGDRDICRSLSCCWTRTTGQVIRRACSRN